MNPRLEFINEYERLNQDSNFIISGSHDETIKIW